MAEVDADLSDSGKTIADRAVTIEAIEKLLHVMDDPVFAYDASGILTYTNKAFDALLGQSFPGGTAVGQISYELEPDKRDINLKMYKTNLSRTPDDPMLIIESPSVGADGKTRWFEWRNLQQFDDEGNVVLVVGISRDITRQRISELRTQRMTERLEESNRDLLEFAQVASHDLREPLRKVAAFSERIERKLGDDLDDQVRDYMSRMNGAVGRMQGLIDDLLTLSRVNTRAGEIESTDLNEVVKATLSDLEIAINESQAVVDVSRLPTLPVDASQIGQLFQNLIANALKFRRPGVAPHVTISASLAPTSDSLEANGAIESYDISVTDNGIGFDQQYASKIFAPFQRLHGRAQYEGTGVGLSVCRRIAERHYGKIWAEGGEGTGAAFTFRLPRIHEIAEASTGRESEDLSGLSVEHSMIDTLAA